MRLWLTTIRLPHRALLSFVVQIAFLAWFFFPFQGFFNHIIFMRPRFLDVQRQNPGHSRLRCYREALWNPSSNKKLPPPVARRGCCGSKSNNNILDGNDKAMEPPPESPLTNDDLNMAPTVGSKSLEQVSSDQDSEAPSHPSCEEMVASNV